MADFIGFVDRWEWVLLLVLTFLELFILRKIYQEARERQHLVNEMQATRTELGRESYLNMIRASIKKAEKEIFFVSHSLTLSMPDREREDLFKLYKDIDHRCITGRDPRRIGAMWEQVRRGVQVRVNNVVLRSTFRFQVCDGRIAVLGFADGGEEGSRKGIQIANVYFCRVLRNHFLHSWEKSERFEEYVADLLAESGSPELSASLQEQASEWNLNEKEVLRLKELVERRAGARSAVSSSPAS